MLFRIKNMVSHYLISQLDGRFLGHMKYTFTKELSSKLSKFIEIEETTSKDDFVNGIRCWEFEAHLLQSRDFDEIADILREVNARTGKVENERIQKIMELLAKDYDQDKEGG